MFMQFGFGAVLLVLAMLLLSAFRILREYERAVVFQLGRFWQVKGPGLILLIPVIQQMVRVDLRTVVLDVPPQDVITRDNVSVKVNAVVYFRVLDPQKAIIQVEDFLVATSQLAQTTLRAVLGKHELDELLAEREQLNSDIRQVLDAQTDAWGIKVANVEIKHVDLNESMVRAIARQAEAERERRAKVIHAEGELQASEKLMQAAQMLSKEPGAMQLRYMQTLGAIAGDKSSTIVFPLPVDLLKGLVGKPANGRDAVYQIGARRKVARNVAAPMNSPAKVRFKRFCCLGVRSKRNTRAAKPVYPAITSMSTVIMVTVIATYCGNSGACGLMNCGSTASMNTNALGLLTLTRKPRSTRLSGLPIGRTPDSSVMSIGRARHCL